MRKVDWTLDSTLPDNPTLYKISLIDICSGFDKRKFDIFGRRDEDNRYLYLLFLPSIKNTFHVSTSKDGAVSVTNGRSLLVLHPLNHYYVHRRSYDGVLRFFYSLFLDTTFIGGSGCVSSPLLKRSGDFFLHLTKSQIITVMGSRVIKKKTYRTSLDGVLLVFFCGGGGFPMGVS